MEPKCKFKIFFIFFYYFNFKKHSKWAVSNFLKIDIDKMGDVMEKLQKTAAYCAKELEANEVARDFK